ncbi:MAG: IS21 family transposase [Desulfobacteraceae bacterium]
MIGMDEYGYIRTAKRVYKKSIKEICRDTGLSRNTVRKALRNEPGRYRRRRQQPYRVLGPYLQVIDQWLEADKESPKKQRHTAKRIFDRLRLEYDFNGSESTVRHYVQSAKIRLGVQVAKAFIPLEPDIGREAEVDWGTAVALIGDQATPIKFFCMRSKYSGKHFVRCYPGERQQAFFDGHVQAFAFFGSIFQTLIYDNLTPAVQKVLRGRQRLEQEAFTKFHAYYN